MTGPVPGPALPGNGWDAVTDPLPDGVLVSVVVTHFEQPDQLARTLRALAAQTHPAALTEVVVADDGSREPPVVPPGVRVVRQEDRGFRAAAARNLGARHSGGDVLVFLDADTAPEPDYLARLVRLPALLPEAVVVGRRRHVDVATGDELAEPAWLREAHARTRDLRDADETSFRFVISAVLACSRWMFELLGGFDETFGAYGGEDWEWAHRAWTHGALLAHEPAAVAWHDGPDHAGRMPGPDEEARALAETLAVARRVPVTGVAPTGLQLGPADPLVAFGPGLDPAAVVLCADSLLAALPRARLLLPPQAVALLEPDPRVEAVDGDPLEHRWARSAWRLLRVHTAVTGPPTAWLADGERLRGPGAPGCVEVADPEGPLLTWRSLRAVRRAARWAREDLDPTTSVPAGGLVRPDPATTVAGRWGGWH